MVSFVYFDLGGVVVLDMNVGDKWGELRRELGVEAGQEKEFMDLWRSVETAPLLGQQDLQEVMPAIRKRFNSKVPEGYSLLLDGFIKRFDANKSIWPIIDRIHKTYRIGLLTDAYPHMLEEITKNGIMPEVKWDVIVDSSAVGVKKPDPKVFGIAEHKAGVKGKEILFIDNKSVNTEAASNFGWDTFLYNPSSVRESNIGLLKKMDLQ